MEVSGELIDLRADLFCMVRIQICGFQHGDIIKRVDRKVLADCRFRFFRSSESAEKICPESSRLDIVRILHKAFSASSSALSKFPLIASMHAR